MKCKTNLNKPFAPNAFLPSEVGSSPTTGTRKKHLREQVLFSVKFVPAERVKYAGACEIACGSEIRLRRVKERILFHILQSRIFHNARWRIISHSSQGEYFTFILFFLESDPCNQANRGSAVPHFLHKKGLHLEALSFFILLPAAPSQKHCEPPPYPRRSEWCRTRSSRTP